MDNTITFRLCDEDRARLDLIIDALAKLTAPTNMTAEEYKAAVSPVEPQSAPETKPEEEPTPAPVESPTAAQAAETAPSEEQDKPTVTLEQIQQLVVKLAAGNTGVKDPDGLEKAKARKAKVRAIINAHAARVSDLPADKWGEVWGQLTALEQEG